MTRALRVPSRPQARRAARLAVLAMIGAVGLSALPVSGSAAPAPKPVGPTVETHGVGSLRAVASDTVEVSQSAPIVAVTWSAAEAPPAESPVFVRVRSDRGGWGPWLETSVSGTTDPSSDGTQRVGTDPVWVGPDATSAQIRLPQGASASARSGERGSATQRGRVELIDPGVSQADSVGGSRLSGAHAVTAAPNIVSRLGWGADESLRRCSPNYGETLRGVVVHHTAGSNSYTSSQSAAIVRGIYAYHTKSLGWCDIGYNVLVDKYGQVFEGRAGGLDRPVTGAHALGFNTDTWGVSVLGNYETASPTSATMSALARVIAWRSSTFYRSPTASTTLTSADSGSRYAKGAKVTLPFISGHRDTSTTACPGYNLYSKLPALRTSVAQIAGYGDSPVYRTWMGKGGAQALGWVSTGERPTPFGVSTQFGTGQSLWSTPRGVFQLGPQTAALYDREGGERSWGAPTTDETSVDGGTRADFAQSTSAIWVRGLDRSHSLHGGVRGYWDALGGHTSRVGMPSGQMWKPTAGGWIQGFQDGHIHYTLKAGGKTVVGGILVRLWQLGGPAGRLGYATTEQVPTGGGAAQQYQGGALWWHSATAAHATVGGIHGRYVAIGGATSSLGFPVNEEHAWSGGMEQDFQGGTIRWERATGAITVTER